MAIHRFACLCLVFLFLSCTGTKKISSLNIALVKVYFIFQHRLKITNIKMFELYFISINKLFLVSDTFVFVFTFCIGYSSS